MGIILNEAPAPFQSLLSLEERDVERLREREQQRDFLFSPSIIANPKKLREFRNRRRNWKIRVCTVKINFEKRKRKQKERKERERRKRERGKSVKKKKKMLVLQTYRRVNPWPRFEGIRAR